MKKTILTCLLVMAVALPVAFGQGKGKGKGKWKDHGEAPAAAAQAPGGLRFAASDSRVIAEYYRPHLQHLPPGLAKKVQRGGTLPPGWQKKVQPFPPELVGRLAPVPAGCSRVVSGGVALLVQDATNVVLDILELRR